MTTCKRVLYWGRVQGVGFRFTAERLAQRFAVTGYVRNLANGHVEMVVEGEDREVAVFIEAVGQKMAGFITGHTIQDEVPQRFEDFTIRNTY